MKIHFKPEIEEKLNRIASQLGRDPSQIVEELVETYVDYDEWFRQEVKKGLAQLNRDEFVEHDDVMAQLEKLFCS